MSAYLQKIGIPAAVLLAGLGVMCKIDNREINLEDVSIATVTALVAVAVFNKLPETLGKMVITATEFGFVYGAYEQNSTKSNNSASAT